MLKGMYPEKNLELKFDKTLNKIDRTMPYRTLPVLFFVFWILYTIYVGLDYGWSTIIENLLYLQILIGAFLKKYYYKGNL